MVVDFSEIKKIVERYDHMDLNELPEFANGLGVNPTAENLAKILQEAIPYCYRVDVRECEDSVAIYEVD